MRKKKRSEFMQGFACAVSSLVKGHGPSTESSELVGQIGTYAEAKAYGVDEYDLEILKPLFKENAAKKRRNK